MLNNLFNEPLSSSLFIYGLIILFLLHFKPKYYFNKNRIRNNLQYKLIILPVLIYTFILFYNIKNK